MQGCTLVLLHLNLRCLFLLLYTFTHNHNTGHQVWVLSMLAWQEEHLKSFIVTVRIQNNWLAQCYCSEHTNQKLYTYLSLISKDDRKACLNPDKITNWMEWQNCIVSLPHVVSQLCLCIVLILLLHCGIGETYWWAVWSTVSLKVV